MRTSSDVGNGPVLAAYVKMVESSVIEWDAAQVDLLTDFDRLLTELDKQKTRPAGGFLQQLLGRRERTEPPHGLYIWGSVGRGKTMLMDLFYNALPSDNKRRAHFNDFMADTHNRIHNWRQLLKQGAVKGDDPIVPIARELAEQASILCFDEFAVTDIADAMILGRLFTALFNHGVVIVATSNVEPDNLYKDGLNRALFLPFIALLKERTTIRHLASRTDFRLEKLGGEPVFHTPNDDKAYAALNRAFFGLTGREKAESRTLMVKGHPVHVPAACNGVARFDFRDLCAQPLAASDYIEVARNFHTILLDNIPRMTFDQRNEAKRFILLIDTLYDRKVKLIASAETQVQFLYQADQGVELFEFDRTVSRLIEMQSEDYLLLAHDSTQHTREVSTGLVET